MKHFYKKRNLLFLLLVLEPFILYSKVDETSKDEIVFKDASAMVGVKSELSGGLPFSDSAFRVLGVGTAENNDGMTLYWNDIASTEIFRQDDGVVVDGVSLTEQGERGVIGVAFRNIRELFRIAWFLNDLQGASERKVNLYVFQLDSQGKPSSTILYQEKSISCMSQQTSVWDIPGRLSLPNGCFICLSSADGKPLSLGMDSGKDSDWPFVRDVNFLSSDYATGVFTSMDNQGLHQNLAVRCYGSASEVSTEDEYGHTYDVWRLDAGCEEDFKSWTLLVSDLDSVRYDDNGYSALPMGVYRYAVDWAGQESHLSAFSDLLFKDMFIDVNLALVSSSSSFVLEGAEVILEGIEGKFKLPVYRQLSDTGGNVFFDSILKGKYLLKISYPGFKVLETEVDFTMDGKDEHDLGDILLEEYLDAPWDLEILRTESPGARLLTWNEPKFLLDDVEGGEDFSIDYSGDFGWSYIDGDKGTPYGISNCTFKNMNKPLAYMVFNPSKTTPALINLPMAVPYSGDKYFAAFANEPETSGGKSVINDDYLISPYMDFETSYIFDFWAKSYHHQYPESFRVWYSSKGKEKSDFIYELTDGPQVAPDTWTNYRFEVPDSAKYVAVQYVSQDKFIFMLDNLRFTEKASLALPISYEIKLDGLIYDTVVDNEIMISGLDSGEHGVDVRAFYKTGISEYTHLDFNVEDKSIGLKFKILDEAKNVIPFAKVYLKGTFHYETKSDNLGNVEFTGVQGNEVYELNIQASGYKDYSQLLQLEGSDLNLDDIYLKDQPMKPGTVFAEQSSDGRNLHLSWRGPNDYVSFRTDDGFIQGGVGSNDGDEKTVVGTVYKVPTILYNMSWMTARQGIGMVNLFVFDLDKNGMPTKKILFEKKSVENIGLQWNVFHFDEPLECPNGFMLGVSGSGLGNVGLGADTGKDSIWPFVPKVNYIIKDYTLSSEEFSSLDPIVSRNLMIRAEGSIGLETNHPKALMGYKIYRTTYEQGEQGPWLQISNNEIHNDSYTDQDWLDLPKGFYRYAVQAVYTSGDTSEMSFSNMVGRKVTTTVMVHVLDSLNCPLEGVSVNLSDCEGNEYSLDSDVEGIVKFESLPTGIYNLSLVKGGFAEFLLKGLDFSGEPYYNIGPYKMVGMIDMPSDLKVEETVKPDNRILSWRGVDNIVNNDVAFVEKGQFTDKGLVIYEVGLDGVVIGETASCTYLLDSLEEGKHDAWVRARKGAYYSEMARISFDIKKLSNENIYQKNKCRIFPNPVVESHFVISCDEDIRKIRIMDLYGRTIPFSWREDGPGRILVVIDVYFQGLLLVEMNTFQGSFLKKILVM